MSGPHLPFLGPRGVGGWRPVLPGTPLSWLLGAGVCRAAVCRSVLGRRGGAPASWLLEPSSQAAGLWASVDPRGASGGVSGVLRPEGPKQPQSPWGSASLPLSPPLGAPPLTPTEPSGRVFPVRGQRRCGPPAGAWGRGRGASATRRRRALSCALPAWGHCHCGRAREVQKVTRRGGCCTRRAPRDVSSAHPAHTLNATSPSHLAQHARASPCACMSGRASSRRRPAPGRLAPGARRPSLWCWSRAGWGRLPEPRTHSAGRQPCVCSGQWQTLPLASECLVHASPRVGLWVHTLVWLSTTQVSGFPCEAAGPLVLAQASPAAPAASFHRPECPFPLVCPYPRPPFPGRVPFPSRLKCSLTRHKTERTKVR